MVRALRPPRRGRRRGIRVRGLEPLRRFRRDPVPGRRGLLPVVGDRDLAAEPVSGRVAERPLARSGDRGHRGRERRAPDNRRDRARTPKARAVRRRLPRGGRAVPDRRGDRVPRTRGARGSPRDRGRRGPAERGDRHDAVPEPSARIEHGPGERRLLRRVRADHRLGCLGLRRPRARATKRRAPGDVPRRLRDLRGRARVREAVARLVVRDRPTRGRPADRVRRAVHRGARERDPAEGDRTTQGPRPVRPGDPHDALGRGDQRRARPGRGREADLHDRREPGVAPDRRAGRGGRAPHPGEPGPRDAFAAGGPRRARSEGGRAPRDRQGALAAPARERDPARVRGTPPSGLRIRGRRYRRARPAGRGRPRQRRLLQDGRAPAVARRRPAVDRARHLDPGRRPLRIAPGDRAGDAPPRGTGDLPRVPDLGDPRGSAPAAAPGP